MIHITDKHNCCGCSACVQSCLKHCISMQQDSEGFFYPIINADKCVDCGMCEKVCPCLHSNESKQPIAVFAAKNSDETVRSSSSSGGVFGMSAERIIKEGGVVFGARFDNDWTVTHDYSETIEGITLFRSSKYVQSEIGDNYRKARTFLNDGRKVLFSGTPCQIAGLKGYLRKEYDNLITIGCVCHGVPSPKLWQQYLKEQTAKDGHSIDNIKQINFRDKSTGWRNYSFTIEYADGKKYSVTHDNNPWIRAFIRNLDLRPSCHDCKFKATHSCADITLGDLWGADTICPQMSDDKGLSLVIVHNAKGQELISSILNKQTLDFDTVCQFNKALVESPLANPKSDLFWNDVPNGFIRAVRKHTKDPFVLRCKLFVAHFISKIR